ncbi:hypothetical protein AB1Y20_018533 [Prymnesium parvum]|uniref:Uncharacterized protein n=1 Tax=Prymnesium parvum TaxID=97485 RepID=A0AB34JRV1_PRYPA
MSIQCLWQTPREVDMVRGGVMGVKAAGRAVMVRGEEVAVEPEEVGMAAGKAARAVIKVVAASKVVRLAAVVAMEGGGAEECEAVEARVGVREAEGGEGEEAPELVSREGAQVARGADVVEGEEEDARVGSLASEEEEARLEVVDGTQRQAQVAREAAWTEGWERAAALVEAVRWDSAATATGRTRRSISEM